MVEEVKKDETQQKETQTKSEEPKKEEVKEEGVKLPERKFFAGDKMKNWAEQSGLLEEEEPAKKPEEKKEEEKKPEEKASTEEEKKPKEEEKKPFKVLTYKGKQVKIMTEEDYDKLASEGLDYTQKSQKVGQREALITEREDAFKKLSVPLETVANAITSGQLTAPKTEEQQTEETVVEKVINNEEIDPESRAAFKALNDSNKALRAEINDSKKVEQVRVGVQKEASLKQATVELEALVVKSKEEHPFDEIIDKREEGEENITESLFTGLVISKANSDRIKASQDPTFQRRNMQDIVTETAQNLNRIQTHYEQKYSISNEEEPVTSAKLKELYPDQIKEIEQDRVASYVQEQEEGAPIAKSVKEEAIPPVEKKKKKEFTGVKDAISQAFQDPEMAKALKEEADTTLRGIQK